MRVVIYGVIGLFALVLQMGLVPSILVDGQGPFLAVAPVVVLGLLYGPGEGAWAGGVIGALVDFSLGAGWGLATLLLLAVGYGAGRLAFAGRALLPVLAFVLTLLAAGLIQVVGRVSLVASGAHLTLASLVPGGIGVVYSAVLAPPLLLLLDGRIGRRHGVRSEV